MRTRLLAVVMAGMAATAARAQFDPEHNHLSCYPIKGATVRRTVQFANQFGTETIEALKPVSLCLPTAKTVDPPGADPLEPTAVPHFKCYKVKVKGKREKRTVQLTDQFGTESVKVSKPNLLCTPVLKDDGTSTTTTSSTPPSSGTSTSTSSSAPPTSGTSTSTSTSSSIPSTSVSSTTTITLTTVSVTTATMPTSSSTSTSTTTTSSTTPSTTSTSTSTTLAPSSTTSTTVPTCTLDAGGGLLMCTGVCPAGFSCLYNPEAAVPCGCQPDAAACTAQDPLQCAPGLCPGGLQACQSGFETCQCVDLG